MKKTKPAKNMEEMLEQSSELIAAICNKEIGKDEAKLVIRTMETQVAGAITQMDYDEKHHPNRKIKFLED